MWVKKPIQQVGFYERASRAGEFRALALILSAHGAGMRIVTYGPEREFVCFLVDSGLRPGIKRGFRTLRSPTRFHLDWPACAAGSRRASGPDPFVACGRDSVIFTDSEYSRLAS